MSNFTPLSRRHVLKGLGATIALPALDAMLPSSKVLAGSTASSAAADNLRMAFFFVPNGVHLPNWTPETTGANFALPGTLEPLAALRNDFMVLSGLTHDKGRANGDHAGDHARSAGVFLTGAQPLKSEGASIRAGMSIDQAAAAHIGKDTRFGSIEMGTEGGRPYGKCDSGYSCAYSNNMSWRDENTPLPKLTNPREVFERLFSDDLGDSAGRKRAERLKYRKSILDFVLEESRQLEKKVGGNDKQKLDEYLTSVRDIEKRIERAENESSDGARIAKRYGLPEGVPEEFSEHLRLLGDMMVLAFQADVTRVCTYMFANAGSNRSYREAGVNEGHHGLSHHQNDPEKHAKLSKINRFHVTQLAYILQRLKATPDGPEGNLLDNSLIVYGSGISDGNRHNNENLPILLAGHGCGTVTSGRHVIYPDDTPMCNLFLAMLRRAGVDTPRFGDSTEVLRNLV